MGNLTDLRSLQFSNIPKDSDSEKLKEGYKLALIDAINILWGYGREDEHTKKMKVRALYDAVRDL